MKLLSIVTASHKEEIYKANLAKSQILEHYSIQIQRGYNNIAQAYNEASWDAKYMMFVHHDVFLPSTFESQLMLAINRINKVNQYWGVIGVAGAYCHINSGGNQVKREFVGHLLDRGKIWGKKLSSPLPVQTLDELLIVVNRDVFDEAYFDNYFDLHFYAADVCMQAYQHGLMVYAVEAYCHHNSSLKPGERTASFRECQRKFTEKWKHYLPIATTCELIQ